MFVAYFSSTCISLRQYCRLFLLLGAVMILAMHGGFAFLEVGSVRRKNQVNALNKIICEWAFSTGVVITICLCASTLVYGLLKRTVGIRLTDHEEIVGEDLSVHMIEAHPEEAL